ncbi:unnamed protein product [Acanthoscelides obtectus]|uniref:Tc1-like transposase DDE domain-containing protein n=1 Tax=Acanthoscelides obtectus TaxID=200917 RepID=A0A9P0K9A5_ACAOB|nr:unnamed protein product [Acanthoscelides obtectus]CAK1651994.1 Histone-lysine N-methyltransferase SETMAR [Acanthoscelides obtectus]
MEWGKAENRIAVIALHKCNHSASQIFELLRGLQISRKFVSRTIQRYNETSSVDDRPRSGRPRQVRTPAAIKAVKARIQRNPLRKQKILSREMKIPVRTMSRIIKQDLGLGAYRRRTGQRLTATLRHIRATRSKKLLERYAAGGFRKILFTDEKIFTIEEKFNRQNDKVYARSSQEASEIIPRVERGHHPASVMVWWGVSYEGVTQLHFCKQGVKTKAANYQSDILDPIQDSAPAHKAKSTQRWLESNVPEFIAAEDWPSGSPDLNPLDYKLWDLLEQLACSKAHRNIKSLKADLIRSAAAIPLEAVRAVIDEWPARLKQCWSQKWNNFQRQLSQQECLAELLSIFSNESPHQSTISRWYEEFKRGRSPKTAVTQENVDAVRKLIIEDRHHNSKILHEELGVRKLVSRWIPHLLTESSMVATFVSKAGHIATIPLNEQRTVTADWYTSICLPKVITELRKINPDRRIILHQDNASSHTAQKTRQYLTEENVELLDHPPYSPDLSPNDFFTFPKIKNRLRGQRFQFWCSENWFESMQMCINLRGEYFEKQ